MFPLKNTSGERTFLFKEEIIQNLMISYVVFVSYVAFVYVVF